MTRDDLSIEMSLARIERLRDGVDRELRARRAGLAGLSRGVLRLQTIVIWCSKTAKSFRAELRSAVRSVEVLRMTTHAFDDAARTLKTTVYGLFTPDGLTARGRA